MVASILFALIQFWYLKPGQLLVGGSNSNELLWTQSVCYFSSQEGLLNGLVVYVMIYVAHDMMSKMRVRVTIILGAFFSSCILHCGFFFFFRPRLRRCLHLSLLRGNPEFAGFKGTRFFLDWYEGVALNFRSVSLPTYTTPWGKSFEFAEKEKRFGPPYFAFWNWSSEPLLSYLAYLCPASTIARFSFYLRLLLLSHKHN